MNFDIVIDSPEFSVDMKSALDTLQGVSDAIRCITETVLTERIPKRQTHKSKVRTNLKENFKGSYGHIFSVDIYDDELKKKFKSIGKVVFSELVAYFLSESLYKEPRILSVKAQKIVDKLGEKTDQLVQQLRVSTLEHIHEIPLKFNYDVKIRFRKSRVNITELSRFTKETAGVLVAVEDRNKIDLDVIVNRFNTYTGNGRFHIKGEEDTVSFGFGIPYKEVVIKAKKNFSGNLDYNNGLPDKDKKHIKVSVSPIVLKNGKVVKYIVKGIYNE